MACRKLKKDVQAIFDKYVAKNVRRMTRAEAIAMLMGEFNLTDEQSVKMFDSWDKDKNGYMSMWEFGQFYETIGKNAQEMLDKFAEMDADNSGKLDVAEAKAGMVSMGLQDKEIEFFLKSSMGDDGLIDISAFGNLLYRLKVYQQSKKK